MQNQTDLGTVNISEEVIATVAGAAAVDCYGIVGMSSGKIKDGIGQLLGKEDFTRGVKVRFENGQVTLDIYVIVNYGVNIAEVAKNVMEKVKDNLNKLTALEIKAINVNVQGVRVGGE